MSDSYSSLNMSIKLSCCINSLCLSLLEVNLRLTFVLNNV
jgi:hypothetical protein